MGGWLESEGVSDLVTRALAMDPTRLATGWSVLLRIFGNHTRVAARLTRDEFKGHKAHAFST